MSNRVFSCKHIIYPEWKCILVDFLQRHWFQDLVPRYFWRDEIYLALFIFKNNTQMTCYLAKSSVLYAVNYLYYCFEYFLAFIYFTSRLHICYLTSCSFHPILYIGVFMLCLFALSDFVYMHFGAFMISFIKYYVFN